MVTNPKDMPPQHYYSLDEYFALEHAGDARFEYWDGDIFCMSGGTRAHGRISSNVVIGLGRDVRGGPCTAFTADIAIWTPTIPPYRYPDASVGCGELKFKNVKGVDALVNPVLIVEVLSPGTAPHDLKAKFEAYRAIDSFRDYLLVAQDEPRVVHYTRQVDGSWTRRDVTDLEATLTIESIGCELSMNDLYEGVTFAV